MHCLQEMWERALKTQNIIGGKQAWKWVPGCLWILADGFERDRVGTWESSAASYLSVSQFMNILAN